MGLSQISVSQTPEPEPFGPGCINSEIDNARVSDLPGRRKEIQVSQEAYRFAWNDARPVPGQMGTSSRLSDGSVKLRSNEVRTGKENWPWAAPQGYQQAKVWQEA